MLLNKFKEYALEINNLIWYFYQVNTSVCYRILRDDGFSEEKSIIQDCSALISVILTQNDSIYIFVQSKSNHLIMYCMEDDNLTSSIITNNYFSTDYIEIFSLNNCLNIIYSKSTENSTLLYHRLLKSDLKLTAPFMLDIVDSTLPYSFISGTQDNYIYICYNKKMKYSCLGYRQYDPAKNSWGKFNILDTTYSPIEDYSFIVGEGEVIAYCYKVNNQSKGLLKYGYGTQNSLVKDSVNTNTRILACSAAFFHGKFFFTYVNDDNLTTRIVDLLKGTCGSKHFTLKSDAVIVKTNYQSNASAILNSMFFSKGSTGNLITDAAYYYSTILPDDVLVNEDTPTSSNTSSLKANSIKFVEYEKQLFENQQLISSLQSTIKDLRYRNAANEEKLKSISQATNTNDQENLKLKANLSSLYESILNKENKISDLEKKLSDNYSSLSTYKNKIEELNKVIYNLENQVNKFNNNLESATSLTKKSVDDDFINKLNQSIAHLKDEISLKDKNIFELNQKNSELYNQIKSLNSSIEELISKQRKSSFIKRIFSDED